ncbi:hypothetical protein EDD85DRAFT_792458 [Armillaria nabsnona]|nr:hypothetical protein EDD85DRAFT_792458 [Armillaria nabsnona]
MMKAGSDFDEDDGDQDTMDVDAAPVPQVVPPYAWYMMIDQYLSEPTWPDYSSTSVRGAAFSSPSFTRPLGSGFPARIVVTNGISLCLSMTLTRQQKKSQPSLLMDRHRQFYMKRKSMEVQGAKHFESIWHIDAAAYKIPVESECVIAQVDVSLCCEVDAGNIIQWSYPEILDIEVKCLVDNFSDRPVYPRWQKLGVPSILLERSSRTGTCFEFSGKALATLSSVADQCGYGGVLARAYRAVGAREIDSESGVKGGASDSFAKVMTTSAPVLGVPRLRQH